MRICTADSLRSFDDEGPGSLQRFISRILDRVLIDMVRRSKATKRGGTFLAHSLDTTETHVPSCSSHGKPLTSRDPSPTSNARATEMNELCRSVLEASEYRIWHQVEVLGRSSEEVAAEFCTSSAAIRGLLFRSRAKLVQALGERKRNDPST